MELFLWLRKRIEIRGLRLARSSAVSPTVCITATFTPSHRRAAELRADPAHNALTGEQVYRRDFDWMLHEAEAKGAVLVAESNRIFVGFVAGWIEESNNIGEIPNSNRVGYISDLCVMPDFRGRRIAAQMLKAIERPLASLGIARLRINSLATNKSARASCERAGFTPYEIMYGKTIVAQD
jgi:GNAT superfamily N-acetyltransferase